MRIGRRQLIIAGSSLGALGAIYAVYKGLTGSPKDIVIAILERRVGYLNIDPADFDTFAEEYVLLKGDERNKLTAMSLIALPFSLVSPYGLLGPGNPLRRLEDGIVSRFLLSTDFFQHDADEQRAITYLSFYDPERAVCRNPLARGLTQQG